MQRAKKIVCFGGGNAMPKVVLSGLKDYSVEIVSVSSMFDSGGSTGQLRRDFNVLPPGDIRRHLLVLSEAPKWKKELFGFRFGQEVFKGGHKGHNLANVFIAGLERVLGNYEEVLEVLYDFLEIKAKCFPVTVEKANIGAILENGKKIFNEDEIDKPKMHNPDFKIKKLFLQPPVKAYPPVLEAIEQADMIVVGPGDIYSSLVPCFLPAGIKEKIRESKAKKVFICNAMTKRGETDKFTVLDFTKEIEKYLGVKLDYVIYNNFIPNKEIVRKYKQDKPELLEVVTANKDLPETKFIGKKLLVSKEFLEYDSAEVAKVLISLN